MNTTDKLAKAERVAWPSASEIADEIDSLLPMSLGDATKAAIEGWWLQLVARKLSKLPITHQALAQRREPLTASQVNELCNECHLDWHRGWSLDEEPNRYLELARAIEKHHGIGATTGKEPGNV